MGTLTAEDRAEIVEKLYLYARAIDAKDFAILDRVFTPDAIIHYDVPGGTRLPYGEMIAWLKNTLAMFRMTQHVVTNPIVEVEGGRTRSAAYLTASHEQVGLDGRKTMFVDHGIYKDDWVKGADGWRIRARRLNRFFMHGDFQMPDKCKTYPTAPEPVALLGKDD